ncbi:N-acetylglucosaminyltransferase, partial [Rhizobium ruizarguesonis]
TRCKEGNLAYFYYHFCYARYDFVAQFDADHVPTPTYLLEVLRPFADPGIGYVSAPSICDENAGASWAARGRLYAEASLHGS